MTAACLCLALTLDAVLGEPERLWQRLPHPAVLMGRLIRRFEERWNHGLWRKAKGCLTVALLCAIAAALGAAIAALPLGALWSTLAAAVLLAQRSLCDHVAAVAQGLRRGGIAEGRAQVARIVGRDTSGMDTPAVARAAIESAAENLSDGVVAPAFWFLVAGLPGMLVYKIVNTADSMIGYRTDRYAQFGWAAARLDDLLNLVPARLTALILTGLYGLWPATSAILAEARRHRSPNAGWPEAAAARALGVALSGPRSYHGQMQDFPYVHPAGAHDIGAIEIDRAVRLLWRVWAVLWLATAMLAILTV